VDTDVVVDTGEQVDTSVEDTDGVVGINSTRMWALEKEPGLRLRLLTIAHMGLAGHHGFDATHTALASRFYWPAMRTDVQAFLRDCLQCTKTGTTKVTPLPWGHQVAADQPGQVLHFDYLYMESGDEEGAAKYLLVLKDGFSHCVMLFPSKTPDSDTAAEAIQQWISVYGPPEQFVSDSGPHFKCAIMDELCRMYSVQHQFTCPHAHWSNGQVERTNKTILKLVRTLISENKMQLSEWAQLIPTLSMVINHTPSKVLGNLAPITVMTGRPHSHPLDTVSRLEVRKGSHHTTNLTATAVPISPTVVARADAAAASYPGGDALWGNGGGGQEAGGQ
jgi:transposase InsO family protein